VLTPLGGVNKTAYFVFPTFTETSYWVTSLSGCPGFCRAATAMIVPG
jgi:hypothetical protein